MNHGVTAVGYDASLEITGTLSRKARGIRLFIAGDEQGTTYSILHTGGHIMLDGQLQIVLEPDLFGFVPTVGETFDMIESPNGISIAEGLSFANFVTVAGVNDLPFGLSLTHYNSGIEGDPDNLFQIGQTLFSYNLVDNDTVLRLTVEAVPEPTSLVLAGFGILGVVALAYCRRKYTRTSPGGHPPRHCLPC